MGGSRGADVKKWGRLIFEIVGRVPVHFRLAREFAQVVYGWMRRGWLDYWDEGNILKIMSLYFLGLEVFVKMG